MRKKIKDMYKDNDNIPYTEINGDTAGYEFVVKEVLDYLEFIKKEPVIDE